MFCKANRIKEGSLVAVLSNGTIGNNVTQALKEIKNPNKIAHFDFAFVKPLDEKLLHEIFKKFKNIITIEDGTIIGGFGNAILEFASQNNYNSNIKTLGIPDKFIEQATVNQLQLHCKIDIKTLKSLFLSY